MTERHDPPWNGIDLARQAAELLQRRLDTARERFHGRVQSAYHQHMADLVASPTWPWEAWTGWYRYAVDLAQRSVLFWDTLRHGASQSLEPWPQPASPPAGAETVLDARRLERPAACALLRAAAPARTPTDPRRRPCILIDPRHGVDGASAELLRHGHALYLVQTFAEPVPGQTLLDLCAALRTLLRRVRELHPDSPRPAIIGSHQGGWAALMLAASTPGEAGPLLIDGAPGSPAGDPRAGAGGDTFLNSLLCDLAGGDPEESWRAPGRAGPSPVSAFWERYCQAFAGMAPESDRPFGFERWWGGFYLLQRQEIDRLAQSLLGGGWLWSRALRSAQGELFDLRRVRSPVILLARLGEGPTPAAQAFAWIGDLYGTTEAVRERGQVVVGLLGDDQVDAGTVAAGLLSGSRGALLDAIEALPPGLYGLRAGTRGAACEFSISEHRLEQASPAASAPAEETPFEALDRFNRHAYELFAQPLVRAMAGGLAGQLAAEISPVRWQSWAFSDLNPWMAWLRPAADLARGYRQAADSETRFRRVESMVSEMLSASLGYYRDVRDAFSEAAFLQAYAGSFTPGLPDLPAPPAEALAIPAVRDALAAIGEGGYPEALARVACLLGRGGEPLPIFGPPAGTDPARESPDPLPLDEWIRIRAVQELVARFAPEQALATLPRLLRDPHDRGRLLALLGRAQTDPTLAEALAGPAQREMLERIREALSAAPGAGP